MSVYFTTMSDKSSKPSPEEIALFRKATAGIQKLKAPDSHLFLPSKNPQPRYKKTDADQVSNDHFSDEYEPSSKHGNEYLDFSRPGIQKKVLRKFRQGKITIEAELDLHGSTVEQARQQLAHFIERSQAHNQRCVRVIHGKGLSSQEGRSILKSKVNHWLQQYSAVMAFSSAQIADGGTGAVYILLKRG